jgi:integrase
LVTADPRATAQPHGITIRDLIARHEHDPSRANVGRRSKAQYRTIYKVLQEVAGPSTPVADVDREVARRVREKLMERGLAESTLNANLTLMVAIFEFAVREGYAEKNVAKGLRVVAKVHAKDLRLPLAEAQLRRIFTSPEWLEYRHKQPSMFWCPLLSLFMSLRLTEAAQMLQGDVKQVDGIWCVEVSPSDNKRVKSRAGHRIIPVHLALVDLGFVEFARAVNTERLFPDVSLSPDGYAGASLGKRWARLMKRLSADGPRTSYHSLRHNWANACRDAKVSDPIMQALGGWSSNTGTAGRYGSGFSAEVLAEEIAKIQPLPNGVLDTKETE